MTPLIHLILLKTRIDLVDLFVDLALFLLCRHFFKFRLGSIHDLVGLYLIWLLKAKVKIDQCATDLNGTALPWEDFQSFLNHDECSELAQVVHEQELVVEEFDLGMVA